METKKFISPKYDIDDDDDFDDDDDDYLYEEEDGKTQELENYLDNKDREEKKEPIKPFNMQSTPFGTTTQWGSPSTPGSSWGNTGGSTWGQPQNNNSWNWGQRTWGQPQNNNSWNWGSNNNNWGSSTIKKETLDRTKKIIVCDLLDCLIETYQSNGKPGLLPRGIYDIRLRFEVWDKIRCFGANMIYAITPKINILTNNGMDSWTVLMNYVTCCLSEYLRVPFQNCQILSQDSIGQPKEHLLSYILSNPRVKKKDVLMIGLNSGLLGQSDQDKVIADNIGIDYVDLGQLMSMYF